MAKKPKEKVDQTKDNATSFTDGSAQCRLLTALATMHCNYKAGDIYLDTPETVERLIDRGMAETVE